MAILSYRTRFLLLLAMTISSCTIINTSSTNTASPTEEITLSPDDIIALGRVCQGQSISNAAVYDSTDGAHPMFLFSSSGNLIDGLPARWQTNRIENVELVACVTNVQEIAFDKPCTYNVGPSIQRYQKEFTISVFEAKTGKLVDTKEILGTEPKECPWQAPLEQTKIIGGEFLITQANDLLASIQAEDGMPEVLRNVVVGGEVHAYTWSIDNQTIIFSGWNDDLKGVFGLDVLTPLHDDLIFNPEENPWQANYFLDAEVMTDSVDGILATESSVSKHGKREERIHLWDKAQNKLLAYVTYDSHLREGFTDFYCDASGLSFSPDGKAVLVVDDCGRIILWDVMAEEKLLEVDAINPRFFNRVFIAETDFTVQAWDMQTWKPLYGLDEQITYDIDTENGSLVTVNAKGDIILWDILTGTQNKVLGKYTTASVHDISLSPKNNILAIAAQNGDIVLLDIGTGKELFVMSIPNFINDPSVSPQTYSVKFNSEGTALLSQYFFPAIWNPTNGNLLVDLGKDNYLPAFSPDGKILASYSSDGSIVLWDTTTGEWLDTLNAIAPADKLSNFKFSHDGSYVAAIEYGDRSDVVYVWAIEKP